MQLSRFLCVSALALTFACSAQAQVIGRPMDAKPLGASSPIVTSTLATVTQLTSQNRGNDALVTLKNAVDSGTIASDHRTLAPMTQQDLATIDLLKSGKQLTPMQIMQIVNRLCVARRGDEAVNLYSQALSGGLIKAQP